MNDFIGKEVKVIRGQTERYIENWKTYYNYIKPHMTFNGLTPSEVAGISIGNERNRWLTLIKLSAKSEAPNATL